MEKKAKEKTIVSGITLVTSLLSYFYARGADKDAMPYVMVGGFVGALVGEAIVKTFFNDDDNQSSGTAAV